MLAKIAAYLVSIGRLLCLPFLYGWRFLHKISLDWPLTLTTQPSTGNSKFSDNPVLYFCKVLLSIAIVYGRPPISFTTCLPVVPLQFFMFFILLYLIYISFKYLAQTHSVFDNFGFLWISQDFPAPRQREISETLFIKFYILIEY